MFESPWSTWVLFKNGSAWLQVLFLRDLSPSPPRTLCHPPEGLSLFCRSTDCRGGCTTAACTGHKSGTRPDRVRKKSNCELCRNSLISLPACLLHKQRDCGTFYFLSFWYFFFFFSFCCLFFFFHISIYSYLTNVYLLNQCFIWLGTHSCAHLVADTEVEAALLIHGIIYPRELRKLGPFVLEGIVQQAVVGAEGKDEAPHTSRGEKNNRYLYWAHTPFRAKDNTVQRERGKKRAWGSNRHTGCICWAPACCSGTSGSGGKLPGPAAPWCCPYWFRRHSGSLGRRAPFPTYCGWKKKRAGVERREAAGHQYYSDF